LEEAPAEVAQEAGPSLVELARRVDPHRLGAATRHLRHTFAPEAVVRDEAHNRERRRLPGSSPRCATIQASEPRTAHPRGHHRLMLSGRPAKCRRLLHRRR
jgi:hypothetical protein